MVGLHIASQSSQGLTSARAAALSRHKAAITSGFPTPSSHLPKLVSGPVVSLRYANSMLALEDTSVERLIYTLRLQHCMRALADKAQATAQFRNRLCLGLPGSIAFHTGASARPSA